MPTSAPTARSRTRRAGADPESGFTLIEMLVAMMLLSLVGLTLARFQTFQLTGATGLATAAAARLEADNIAVDVLAAPAAPDDQLAVAGGDAAPGVAELPARPFLRAGGKVQAA